MKRYKGHVIKRTAKGAYDVYYLGERVAHGPDLSGAKFWIDHYGKKSNPGRRLTKTQKRAAASKRAKQRGIIKAVRAVLKRTNPSAKITGASVVKLKGGVLKITPIRENPRSSFGTEAEAERFARHIGKHQRAKVVKKGGKWVTVWSKSGYRRGR